MTRFSAILLVILAGRGSASAEGETPAKLELQRFRVVHTPAAVAVAASVARILEDERNALAVRLGRDWDGVTDVLVAGSADEARGLAPGGVQVPRWSTGLAASAENTIFVDARAFSGDDGRRILRRELAHLAIDRLGQGRFPLWLREGFATLAAEESGAARHLALYRAATRPEAALPLDALADSWPEGLDAVEIAFAQSASFVALLEEDHAFRTLVAAVAAGTAFEEAFRAAYHVPVAQQEAAWRGSLQRRYAWIPVATHPLSLTAAVSLGLAISWLRLRRRARARLEDQELDEQAREAALRIAAAERAQAHPGTRPERDDDRPPPKPVLH